MSSLSITNIRLSGSPSGAITNADGSTTFLSYDSSGNVTIPQFLTFGTATEILEVRPASTSGAQTYSLSTTTVFYHPSVAGTITASFTNVPTTPLRAFAVSLIVVQGGTGYGFGNSININGSATTIRWSGGTAPTPGTSRTDIYTLSIVNISSTTTPSWVAYGNKSDFN
jgi:hypothetical protein